MNRDMVSRSKGSGGWETMPNSLCLSGSIVTNDSTGRSFLQRNPAIYPAKMAGCGNPDIGCPPARSRRRFGAQDQGDAAGAGPPPRSSGAAGGISCSASE